jgi:hypothetical protein
MKLLEDNMREIVGEPGVLVHACNPRTWEVKAGGSQV